MSDTFECLSSLGQLIMGSSRAQISEEVRRLREMEKWLAGAHFLSSQNEIIRPVGPIVSDRVSQFQLARRWHRRPTRVPMLIVESRLVIASTLTAELLIQRSEENYVVIRPFVNEPAGMVGHQVEVKLDVRHEDPFQLSLRRNGINSDQRFLDKTMIGDFLQRLFGQL